MGRFDMGDALFFLVVFKPQHILLSINWHEKKQTQLSH